MGFLSNRTIRIVLVAGFVFIAAALFALAPREAKRTTAVGASAPAAITSMTSTPPTSPATAAPATSVAAGPPKPATAQPLPPASALPLPTVAATTVRDAGPGSSLTPAVAAIIILSLVLASMGVAIAWLAVRWRKALAGQQTSILPNVVIDKMENLERVTNDQAHAVHQFADVVSRHMDRSKLGIDQSLAGDERIMEALGIYQAALSDRDVEIDRLRKGYDAIVFRRFLQRFIRVLKIVDEEIASVQAAGGDARSLHDVRLYLQDALEECGVVAFAPRIGDRLQGAFGIADKSEPIITDNPDLALTIAEVRQSGFAIKTVDGLDCLKEAVVAVYVIQVEEVQP